MRRKDREVTDPVQIEQIVQRCDVCRMAMVDQGMPYVVPMNFGYTLEGNQWTLYFHSAKEGRMPRILHENPAVCVEMDGAHALLPAQEACGYGMAFESVILEGEVEFARSDAQKVLWLNHLMRKVAPNECFAYAPQMLAMTEVFCVRARHISAKQRSPKRGE